MENINSLKGMGYSARAARQALHQAGGNLDEALKVTCPPACASSPPSQFRCARLTGHQLSGRERSTMALAQAKASWLGM